MIYKSRNGIGIRVILITLFFFFMLTDAKPNDSKPIMEKLAEECATDLYIHRDTVREINPDFNEAKNKEAIEKLAESAIKSINYKLDNTRGDFWYIFILYSFLILFFIFILFGLKLDCLISKPHGNPHANHPLHSGGLPHANHPLHSVVAGIIAIIVIIIWILLAFWMAYKIDHQEKACRNLEQYIEKAKKFHINRIAEENMVKVSFVAEILMEYTEEADTEGIVETKVKEEVSKVEKNEFSEETKFSMESAITITDTSSSAETELETYYEDYSVTSEFNASNKEHKKKDEKKGCLLDNIDLNRFIYAMVLVFALFAIYTFCNFEEEEETGEITEV